MDLTLLALLRRHWQVSLLLLAITGALAWWVAGQASPTYHARGSVMLASPTTDPSRAPETVIDLRAVADTLTGPAARAAGAEEDVVTQVRRLDAATLDLQTVGPHPEAAEQAMEALIERVEHQLEEQQADILEDDRLRSQLLTPDTSARAADGAYRSSSILWVSGIRGAQDNPISAGSTTIRLLRIAVGTEEGRSALADRLGPDVEVRLSHDRTDPVPLMFISTAHSDPDEAIAAFDVALGLMADELDRRQAQADVPAARRIFLDVIGRPEEVVEDVDRTVPAALVVLLGVAMSGGVAGLLERRARTRHGSGEPAGSTDDAGGQAAPRHSTPVGA